MSDEGKAAGWTVMIYMTAADDPELDAHAVRDLQDMERATLHGDVLVRVQLDRHWPALPQRYCVEKGKSTLDKGPAPVGETGTEDSLLDFLKWASAESESGRLFLVLWGHAYGLGFGRDHGDPLTLQELGQALATFKNYRKERAIDLLGANACAMSYAEAAFQLRGVVDYMVASQIAVPFAGWPYEAILSSIDAASTPVDVGKIVADRYVNHFRASRVGDQVAMSLLDLAPGILDTLEAKLKAFATSLMSAIELSNPKLGDRLDHIRSAFLATAAGDVRPLVDLYDLCDKVVDLCGDLARIEMCSEMACRPKDGNIAALKSAGQALRDFLEPASSQVTGEETAVHASTDQQARTFVLAHKRHPELDGLHGVGIFAPFVTDDADLKRLGLLDDSRPSDRRRRHRPLSAREEYGALALVKALNWDTLVYDTLSAGLPPDVMTNIEGSGAVSVEDREAVAQMLAAVDSTFATLERRVAATQLIAMPIIARPNGSSGPALEGQGRVARFSTLRLMPRESVDDILAMNKPAKTTRRKSPANNELEGEVSQILPEDHASTLVDAFHCLEKVVADVERAVRRTVTNGSLGLGASAVSDGGLGKRGLGKRGLGKRGLGKRGLGKRGLGSRLLLKRKLGVDGLDLGDALSPVTFEAAAASIMAGLFEEVGAALAQLELATSELEVVSLEALAAPGPTGLSGEEAQTLTVDAVRRAFRMLSEASIDARRTIRRVLSHPVYGFGPNADGLTAEDRRELARAGGLNGDELDLL